MPIKAGLASDESGVRAIDLNQTHIGLAFGTNLDDGTVVYGRIAACHLEDDIVLIHMEGVGTGEDYAAVHLKHHEMVYFTQYSHERELVDLLEVIRKNTSPRGVSV